MARISKKIMTALGAIKGVKVGEIYQTQNGVSAVMVKFRRNDLIVTDYTKAKGHVSLHKLNQRGRPRIVQNESDLADVLKALAV